MAGQPRLAAAPAPGAQDHEAAPARRRKGTDRAPALAPTQESDQAPRKPEHTTVPARTRPTSQDQAAPPWSVWTASRAPTPRHPMTTLTAPRGGTTGPRNTKSEKVCRASRLAGVRPPITRTQPPLARHRQHQKQIAEVGLGPCCSPNCATPKTAEPVPRQALRDIAHPRLDLRTSLFLVCSSRERIHGQGRGRSRPLPDGRRRR